MHSAFFVLASLLCADVPGVAELIPADALAVVATDDLAELTRRARTLPAAIEFSHDEWKATVEHVALLARGLAESLPPEWTRSELDLSTVSRAFAALVQDGERSCCVVIGLEGRDGKPPKISKEFLLYPGAGIEGDVLVVGTRAAALDRARAVVRGEAPSLATMPRFSDALDTWTRPAHGIWIWSHRDALVDAQSRGAADLGPFIGLVEQRLGHAYAWTLDIVEPQGSPPTIATTTWIATHTAPNANRPAFDRSTLRVVPAGTPWFQTVHWDPEHVLESLARETIRSRALDVARVVERLLLTPRRAPYVSSRELERIEAADPLVGARAALETLAADANAFREKQPLLASILTELRPPLVVFASMRRGLPSVTVCCRTRESGAVSRDFITLLDASRQTPLVRAGVTLHASKRLDAAIAIVDDWLVLSTLGGVCDAIDHVRLRSPSILDDARFGPTFDRLIGADPALDVSYCDAPSLLSAHENMLLGSLTILGRDGANAVDAFALPVLEDLPDVAPASVGIARATPHGFRIDREGFLGGECTGIDGLVGIAAGLAPIIRTHVEVQRALDTVRDDLDELRRLARTLHRNQGKWFTYDELATFVRANKPGLADSLNDPWGEPYRIEPIDAGRCRLSCLGADHAPGGVGLDTDVECIARDR